MVIHQLLASKSINFCDKQLQNLTPLLVQAYKFDILKKLKSKKNSKLKRKTQEYGNICLKEEKNEYDSAPKY